MKKLIKPSPRNSHIYLYEGSGYKWKMTIWTALGCDGYWVRCELPGNECNHYMQPTCFPWP